MTIKFLDPRQRSHVGAVKPAKRLETFANKRLGLLWNNKPGGDRLLRFVAQLIDQKWKLADIYFTKKTYIGNAASPEIINDLVSRVDAVIAATGD